MYEPILDMDIVELLNLYKLIVEFNKEEIEELVAIDQICIKLESIIVSFLRNHNDR